MDRFRCRRLFLPLAIACRLHDICEVIVPRAAEKLTMDLSQKKTARFARCIILECLPGPVLPGGSLYSRCAPLALSCLVDLN